MDTLKDFNTLHLHRNTETFLKTDFSLPFKYLHFIAVHKYQSISTCTDYIFRQKIIPHKKEPGGSARLNITGLKALFSTLWLLVQTLIISHLNYGKHHSG